MSENIHKIFYDDVRENKVISRGLRGRASRKQGIKGSLNFSPIAINPLKLKNYMER